MALPFAIVPAGARIQPSPFKVAVSDEQIKELHTLIKLSKPPPQTYEGSQKDRRYGVTSEWMATAKDKWLELDWRAAEKRINSFPQFTYEIEGLTIHFAALFSEKKDAIPIVLLHGWPGDFLEFLPLLALLREKYDPQSLPYHLVVPSLPGYAFSSGPPVDKNFASSDIARVINQLMVNLGFENGYVAQGGDVGSRVARVLGVDHDACKAVHLNLANISKPASVSPDSLTSFEQENLARAGSFKTFGTGYFVEHGTKTSTIGHVISSSPVALLAWVGEKFLDWVDVRDPLPLETILESISLYWFTETFPRSIYTYREAFPPPPKPLAEEPRWFIHKPFGFSYFPRELMAAPRSWVETTGNLVYWSQHDKGGHFAALERPEELAADVTAFAEQVWPAIHNSQ